MTGRVLAGVGALILVFLLLSRADDFNSVLNVAGGRFIDIVGTLQGRQFTTGQGKPVRGVV